MKHYDALACTAARDTLDIITALSSQLPITGILDSDTHIVLYFNEGGLTPEIEDTVRIWGNGNAELKREQIEEQNWNAEFERSLEPVRISDRLVITQSWNPVEPTSDHELVVVIDPKMSFGTGHHESTRLISKLMLDVPLEERSVLDIGTGTGALAIIAAKFGSHPVIAFDNNEWAVENSRENFERNDVESQIHLFQGEIADLDPGKFDVILANLHRNLIIELLPQIVERLSANNPRLLTSGVLFLDYEGLIAAAAKHGLYPVNEARENDWIASEFAFRA